eukprot:gnl/MRDRNA2_/MRDRNA2_79117_c0_seq4.p3 gnl/MRDRNA2_/MRDRNA2_79117_c0~~gnl/MRDRNA2_/MRDRNA2_79117_c0_seq4.p3  ORF type:complete len:112 (-),score=35.87 gnl/MRDRNA2_/MRDRNA2_79117_c0_seq4:645-980(-)
MAFAKATWQDVQLFMTLTGEAKLRLSSFTPQQVADTAYAFAASGELEPSLAEMFSTPDSPKAQDPSKGGYQLFNALAQEAMNGLDDLTQEDISLLAWAFAAAGRADKQLFG